MVLAGARVGARCVVADQAHVRERAELGAETVVGRGVAVDNDVRVGARVKLQTGAYIAAWSLLEDDVFVAPRGDAHERRHDGAPWARSSVAGAVLRAAAAAWGAGAVLLPGVEVGEGVRGRRRRGHA